MNIKFEHKDFLIVEKDAGIPTLKGKTSPSIEEILLKNFPNQAKLTECGVVHRLDNIVSGLLLVAKNQNSYDKFRKMFSNSEVLKEYTLLVHGYMKANGKISAPISTKHNSKKSVISENGQKALTEYKCVGQYLLPFEKNMFPVSEIIARTKSGKRHQVRIHFSSIGSSVVGDPLYDKKHNHIVNRIFFHASALDFEWEKERFRIESVLPIDLLSIERQLIERR